MKMIITVSLFYIYGLTFASDGHGDLSKHTNTDSSGHEYKKSGEDFNKVLKSYEELHQAFFENDNSKVRREATEVKKSIEGIRDKKIAKTLSFAKEKLSEIASSSVFEANKESFGTVSHALLIILEKHSAHKIYRGHYCPMVKKYWIQNTKKSKKVMNPYASTTMPHCGEPQ